MCLLNRCCHLFLNVDRKTAEHRTFKCWSTFWVFMPAPLHQMDQLFRCVPWNQVLRRSVTFSDTLTDLVFAPGIWRDTWRDHGCDVKVRDGPSFGVPTHLRTALPLWGWPTPRWRSCRHQTSQWRVCVCCPGAQVPCSSGCRHISPRLTALCGSSCETPPLWVCSKLEIWPIRGLQSGNDTRRSDDRDGARCVV